MRATVASCHAALLGLLCGVAQAEQPTEQRPAEANEANDPLFMQMDLSVQSPRGRPSARANVPVHHGEVLDAISGVAEQSHRVRIQLDQGLAKVDVQMTFESDARHPAEIRYRLPLPPDAEISLFEVCRQSTCRPVQREARDAHRHYVRAIHDPNGLSARRPMGDLQVEALGSLSQATIRAAPVLPSGRFRVRLSYVAPAQLAAGISRFTLPARGRDPRAAPTSIMAHSHAFEDVRVEGAALGDGQLQLDPWYDATVRARLPVGSPLHVGIWQGRCGEQRCARTWLAAPARRHPPERVVLALDRSPSMRGTPDRRVAVVLSRLLEQLPREAKVRVVWFASSGKAARARWSPPHQLSVPFLVGEHTESLGSMSKLSAAWKVARPWVAEDPPKSFHWVVLGDGALTRGRSLHGALRALGAHGARVSLINVADHHIPRRVAKAFAGTGGAVVEVGDWAAKAVAGEDRMRLSETLSQVWAPPVTLPEPLPPPFRRLRAGFGAEVSGYRSIVPGQRLGIARNRASRSMAPAIEAWVRARLEIDEPKDAVRHLPSHRSKMAAGATRVCPDQGTELPQQLMTVVACPDEQPEALPEEQAPPSKQTMPPPGTVQQMMKVRVLPGARRCLRVDRAGRLDHSVRATYDFMMERGEVTQSQVRGDLTPELRQCLDQTLERLDVPHFAGAVRVRYPIFTRVAREAPRVELTKIADAEVERAMRKLARRSE